MLKFGKSSAPTAAGNKAASELGMKPQALLTGDKNAKMKGQRKAIIGTGLASR